MHILLTGATGTIGSQLALRLLAGGHEVSCLVRGRSQGEAKVRLARILGEVPSGLDVVVGDVTKLLCGIDPYHLEKMGHIDAVVHAAAALDFDERKRSQVLATNVQGTRHILELVEYLNIPYVCHVSTAYVGGAIDILTEDIDCHFGIPRNSYEESKQEAEVAVCFESNRRMSVLRLPIVIGNKDDGHIVGRDGYYSFFKPLDELARRYGNKLPVQLTCVAGTPLHLVTCDWTVRMMAMLVEDCAEGVFNLTHPDPQNVEWVIETSLDILGISVEQVRTDGVIPPVTSVYQRVVNYGLQRYAPYVTHSPRFVSQRTRLALGARYRDPPGVTQELLSRQLAFMKPRWEAETEARRRRKVSNAAA